ncbi:MAG: HAD hydrolase family protein, partial [Ruminococcus sp.]
EKFQDDERIIMFMREFLKRGASFLKTGENPDFGFDKFIVWVDENTDRELFYSSVSQYYTMIDRGNGLFENVPKGFSKATGIYKILEILGIDISNAYAIGDSMNDLSMLQAVPNSIAMGQGTSVHKYVSYITDDIYNDGIWNALKHFELI